MRRSLCVLLLLVPAACGRGSRHLPGAASPTEAAGAFHRLVAEAEWAAAADYLVDEDVALWADGKRADRYPELELDPEGAPGVLTDSARLRSRRGDTAFVEVFTSGPDWSDRRWHRAFDSLFDARADRTRVMEKARRLRRTLSLEKASGSVPVLLQDGRWRVSLGLRIRERFRRQGDAMRRWSEASRPRERPRLGRMRAAAAYLALADSFPLYADTSMRRDAAEMLRLAPYVDSVDVQGLSVLPVRAGVSMMRGTARNRSATALEWVTIQVMDRTGFAEEVILPELPAHATAAIDLSTRLEPGKPRAAVVAWTGASP